jgi:pimeloyl-ACP methyl ester carboxylesterase
MTMTPTPVTPIAPIIPITLAADVRAVAPVGVERIVADVFFPPPAMLGAAAVVVVCLPGGGMSRRYFDLRPTDGDDSYSMARYLAAAGFVVVTLDPPGVGDSDRPADGYTLTPYAVADVVACAVADILDRLRDGSVDSGVGPLENLLPIGLGHSAGALLTVVQQARSHCYDALVLLGFRGGGLIEFLTDDERRYADDPAGLRSALAVLTEERFGDPLPKGTSSNSSFLIHGEPPATAMTALREATAPLLGLVGLTSLVPGSIREEMETIDVPVFLGVGEHDITGRAQGIPNELPASRDITVFVLPDAGHNQNVAGTRTLLWRRTARWIDSMREIRDAIREEGETA